MYSPLFGSQHGGYPTADGFGETLGEVSSTVSRNVTAYWDTVAPNVSIDAAGEYAVLGGLRGLNIIDLESPFKPARILHHHSRQSGSTVAKWNPNLTYLHFLSSTSNLNVLIWDLERISNPMVATFQGHKRSVNDIAWSPKQPDTIASCDADGYVYIWDLRAPRRPSIELHSDGKGTAQVQWNRHFGNILASVHENKVELWDLRGGHSGKQERRESNTNKKSGGTETTASFGSVFASRSFLGFDWSYTDAHEFLTCGDDKSINFWKDNETSRSFASLKLQTSVWKASYTPFGHGMVSTARRNDPTLRLWNLDNVVTGDAADLVQIYRGHDTQIRSFGWRFIDGRHQLVSWGADKKFCLWRVERHHVKECGGVAKEGKGMGGGEVVKSDGNFGGDFGFRSQSDNDAFQQNNSEQQSKYNPIFLKGDVDDFDVVNSGDGFGAEYREDDFLGGGLLNDHGGLGRPNQAEVEEWQEWSHSARSLEEEFDIIRRHLGGVMSGIPGALINIDLMSAVDRQCVVECVVRKKQFSAFARVSFKFPTDYAVGMDQPYRSVPNITLLNSSPPSFLKNQWKNVSRGMDKMAEKKAAKGRRALEVLLRRLGKGLVRFVDNELQGGGGGGGTLFQMEELNNSGLEWGKGGASSAAGPTEPQSNSAAYKVGKISCGIVFSGNYLVTFSSSKSNPTNLTIADVSKMLHPINQELATAYEVPPLFSAQNLGAVCERNAIAAEGNRYQLAAEAWSLVASISHRSLLRRSEPSGQASFPSEWSMHPLGKVLLQTVIKKLQQHNDIQTIAVVSAVLQQSGLMDEKVSLECERIRHIYAEILYRWGLFSERSVLLKRSLHGSVEDCPNTTLTPLQCVVCTLTIRLQAAVCIFCGHAGHVKCFREWFEDETCCPSGCGCQCKLLFANSENPGGSSQDKPLMCTVRNVVVWRG